MFEDIAVKAIEEALVSAAVEAEALQQLGELQLLIVGGGIGTVTIA